MPQLRIDHWNAGESLLPIAPTPITRSLNEQWRAEITVPRDDFQAVADEIDDINDEFYLEEGGEVAFGGRLDAVNHDDTTVELIVGSPETDAIDAANTPPAHTPPPPDSAMVHDALDRVDTLTAGTVETLREDLFILADDISPRRLLRAIRKATGGELVFDADWTVDYVGRMGTDREQELSPAAQTLMNVSVRRNIRDQVTHLTVKGVGEGEHRVTATAVSENYAGGRTVEDDHEDRRISDPAYAQAVADRMMADIDNAPKDIQLSGDVRGVEPNVGDSFPVRYPKRGVDHRLRVTDVTKTLGGEPTYACTFKSRPQASDTPAQDRIKDLETFNGGRLEGNPIHVNVKVADTNVVVGDGVNEDVYYPLEVLYEHRMRLRIIGTAYRTDVRSSLRKSNPDPSWSVGATTTTDVSLFPSDTDFDTIESVVMPEDKNAMWVAVEVEKLDDSPRRPRVRLRNVTEDVSWPRPAGARPDLDPGEKARLTLGVPGPRDGDEVALEIQAAADTTEEYRVRAWWRATGHAHNLAPGVRTWAGDDADPNRGDLFPENVTVLLNGETIADGLGDGTGRFEEVIDIRGRMNAGELNTVSMPTDGAGHLVVYLEGDAYRQVGRNPEG